MTIQEFDFATGKVLDPARRQAILYVTDDQSEQALTDGVRQKSYKLAAVARDIREALGHVKKHGKGVFFVDADGEGFDPLAIMRTIKQHFPEIKVVPLTAKATKAWIEEATAAGAIGFIAKPVASEAVANILARLK